MYKLAFFDVDGTLLMKDQSIPASTKEAIHQLKSQNIIPILATGRTYANSRTVAEELDIDTIIALNGGVVIYEGNLIYGNAVHRSSIEHILQIASENGDEVVFCGMEDYYRCNQNFEIMKPALNFFGWVIPEYDPTYYQKYAVYQLQLFCRTNNHNEYSQRVPELKFVSWNIFGNGYDVVPYINSKADGIAHLIQRLGVKPSECIAFGDGLNDMEMLRYVGLGVAMGNANPNLKEVADYVTTSVEEDGIYRALQKVGIVINNQ